MGIVAHYAIHSLHMEVRRGKLIQMIMALAITAVMMGALETVKYGDNFRQPAVSLD